MHLEHVNISVRNLEKSKQLYSELLQLQVRWNNDQEVLDGRATRACHLGDDSGYIAMFEALSEGGITHDYHRPGINHFGFIVDDIEHCRRVLASFDLYPHFEPEYEPGKRLYFYDWDNIEVELVQY